MEDTVEKNHRQKIGENLDGIILEIGPGSRPFPIAQSAKAQYVDRSVLGGRDANWPELIGHPRGVDADYDLNIDTEGLSPISNESFDCVIASHVLEHLANPVRAIQECERVLRFGGKLVLIMPDRNKTFDSVRVPTTLEHVIEEFQSDVNVVSEAHIVEFCKSIYKQPSIHPEPVREWHNPEKLDDALFALHRRRSIHVHCWSPEEFASLITGMIAQGLITMTLHEIYFDESSPGNGEFGLVLQRSRSNFIKSDLSINFINKWISLLFLSNEHHVQRLSCFQRALCRDGAQIPIPLDDIFAPLARIAEGYESYRSEITVLKLQVAELKSILTTRDNEIRAIYNSSSWRWTSIFRNIVKLLRKFI